MTEIEIDLEGVDVTIDCPICHGGEYDHGEGCKICSGTGELEAPVKRGLIYEDISEYLPSRCYNEGML